MNSHQDYRQNLNTFLNDLEASQRALLKLDLTPFLELMRTNARQFTRTVLYKKAELGNTKRGQPCYLLQKQMDLLSRGFKEIISQEGLLSRGNLSPDQLIYYFERQLAFKKILRRHLSDVDRYLLKQ